MICADACTVILLAKASVLEVALHAFKIVLTKEVYEEVIAGKKMMFQDALLLERLHHEQKIIIIPTPEILQHKLEIDFNMGRGEASVIAVGIADKEIVIATDNRQGRKSAQINNLSLVGSIEIIVSLYQQKKISEDKAKESLRIVEREGWFSPYLIEKAKEDLR
ncbi:MAG TPA: hypothetical protein VJI15_00265 [Candidatus Nanoarchaeia archaeon]|nr:hypothetical protein [Candidatus Nanoarchaeia archaeon]